MFVPAPPAGFIFELVADASVEPLLEFWPQPVSAKAASKVMADRVIIVFIGSLVMVEFFESLRR